MSTFQFFIMLAIFAVCNSALAVDYEIVNLGSLTTGGTSWAYSINNAGQIVGRAQTASGAIVACKFDNTGSGSNTNLGALSGYSDSYAYSINDSGKIVGWSQNSSTDTKACDFTGGSALELASGTGIAAAVNNAGITVGIYDGKAYNFTSDSFLSSADSYALGINNGETVVGTENVGGTYKACIFDSGGNIILSDSESYAYSINNAGQIVGSENSIACIFDSTGGGANTSLGTLGGSDSLAIANNSSGKIVGYSQDDSGSTVACLFDSTGKGNNTNLNDLIDSSLGWNLKYAYDINDDGWIVGLGTHDGVETAYLLKVVPEPATIAILSIGGLLFIRKKI
jgi:probable HAF family extracellular repeat protein